MAIIENLSLANTFGQWVNKTNDIVDTINVLYEGDFTKPTGTLYLNEPSTALSVSNNSLFNGLVEIGPSGSLVAHGIGEIQQTLYLTNVNPAGDNKVLVANGIVSLTGVNHALQVSNNATINGTLNVDNIYANTITVSAFNSPYLNAAFAQANSAASFANGSFVTANSGASFANGAFLTSNNSFNVANASFSQANNAFNIANVAYIQANNGSSFANSAFTKANTTNDLAYIVYAFANTGYTQANNAASFANSAYTKANTTNDLSYIVYGFANTGYTQANNAASFANGAFTKANTALSTAWNANLAFNHANSVYDFANTGYTQANDAASFANSAFTKANTTNDLAYIIYAYANTAYTKANNAASFANGAFTTANAALPKVGGTLTGDITGANASFQNISASGNFTINGTTVYNSDTFTLNSATVINQNGTFSNYRPSGTSNAAIRWTESILSWGIRDVNNTDSSTSYANVVTSNLTSSTARAGIVQLTDSISSTSTTTAATPNAVKTSYDLAISGYAFANTGYTQANNAASFANGAFTKANSAGSFANGAFTASNSAASFANSAYAFANTLASTSGSFDRANSAYNHANSAYGQANSAASFANGAFTAANTKFNAAGGTISGDVSVTGNLTVNGTTTYIYSKTVDINDSLIHLANNNTSGDTLDIGFYGTYNTGGFNRYSGLFRKAADKYYLVQGLTNDPSQNTVTFTSLNRSTLDTNITGGTVSGLSAAIPVADGGSGTTTSTGTGSLVLHSGPELISPNMSGMPMAPTAAAGNNSTMVATTAFVQTAIVSSSSFANGAFVTANSAASFANGAFTEANTAHSAAQSGASFANGAFTQANTAQLTATSGASFANGAFTQANNTTGVDNTQNTNISSAQSYANGAFTRANSAYNYANSAIFSATAGTGLSSNVASGTGNISLSLATTAVAAGTYGGASQIPVVTIDTYGRATYAANVTFSGGATITDDTTTDATRYPLFASSTSGTLSTVYTSSTELTYNPSTGTLSAVIFTSLSDRNVKDNIQVVTNALDTIKQLEGVSFSWKENGNKSYGVIAQDVEQVLPDVVQTNDAGLKTVDYQSLSAFLIESIKELKTEIDTLKELLYNK